LFFQLREEIVHLVLAVATRDDLEFYLVKATFTDGGAIILAHIFRLIERVHDLGAAEDRAPRPSADYHKGE